jgi:hypothetical protein
MVAVWVSMSDHFLDNETRPDLPLTALHCVEAGLSAAQARDIWRFELVPAVGANLLSMVGEWGCWNRDWLVERILRVRRSWWNRPGLGRKFHLPLVLSRRDCHTMERCIEILYSVPEPVAREQLARDFVALARIMLDFGMLERSIASAEDRERLSQLYPTPFKAVMWPVLFRSERADAEQRIQHALFAVGP